MKPLSISPSLSVHHVLRLADQVIPPQALGALQMRQFARQLAALREVPNQVGARGRVGAGESGADVECGGERCVDGHAAAGG
jgi:hypothetical protein